MDGMYDYAVGDQIVDHSVNMRVQDHKAGYFCRVYMGPDSMQPAKRRDEDSARAFDPEPYDWVALRTLRRELLRQPATYERFVEESLLWVGLWDHPNILKAQYVSKIKGVPYIHLDYAEKGSLRDVLQRDPTLSLDQRMWWAQQIAAGLVELHAPYPNVLRGDPIIHSAPIVHRDLKPENILLLGGNRAQITDLGLANILDTLAESPGAPEPSPEDVATLAAYKTGFPIRTGRQSGTPAYMAPEQWTMRAPITPKVDVYALGLILSELLARRHALLDDLERWRPPSAWEAAHCSGTPRPLRDVVPQLPEELEVIYLRCLEKAPQDRPDAREVFDVLQESSRGRFRYGVDTAAIPNDSNLHIFWHNWAAAYELFGRLPEALERIDRALALNPNAYYAQALRANILTQMGRSDEANVIIGQLLTGRYTIENMLPKRLQQRAAQFDQSYRRRLHTVEQASIQRSIAQDARNRRDDQSSVRFQADPTIDQARDDGDESGDGSGGAPTPPRSPQSPQSPGPAAPASPVNTGREEAHIPQFNDPSGRLNPDAFYVGQRLTDFAGVDMLVQRIAQGGFGQVAMGPDQLTGRWVALKVLRPDLLRGSNDNSAAQQAQQERAARLRAAFLREALIWRGLWPHPNLLTAQAVTEINGQLVLVLDYAERGSLRDLFMRAHHQGSWLAPTTSLQLAQQIAAGLVELHTPRPDLLRDQPIVHRDLKPENVLLDAYGYAMITDFGLAKAVEEATVPLVGAPTPVATNRNLAGAVRNAALAQSQPGAEKNPQIAASARPPLEGENDLRNAVWSMGQQLFGLHSASGAHDLGAAFPFPTDAASRLSMSAANPQPAPDQAESIEVNRVSVQGILDSPVAPPPEGPGTEWYRTQRGMAMGTPAYMAPEQWEDAALAGRPADAYAFGVLLVELFTSQHPLLPLTHPHSLDEWRLAHLTGAPRTLAELGLESMWQAAAEAKGQPWTPAQAQAAAQATEELDQLCAALMAKAPAARPTLAEALTRLQAIALNLGETPYAPDNHYPPTPERQRIFWTGWADAYERFDLHAEALARIERARAIAPDDPGVLTSQATILAGLGRTEEAVSLLRQALAHTPDANARWRDIILNQLANRLGDAGRYAEAEEAYAEQLSLQPEYAIGWFNRAINEREWAKAEIAAGRWAEARAHAEQGLAYAERARTLNPENPRRLALVQALRQLVERLQRDRAE